MLFRSTPVRLIARFALAAAALAGPQMARAEMVLSQVIVDFQPGASTSEDIEVWNAGEERIYVLAEPAEIVSAGLPDEQRIGNTDPAKLGLLVTPQRMVLEPGQRRMMRIASLVPQSDRERVYRVMVRPVVGKASSSATALKVLVGYDMLVLQRPSAITGGLNASRAGKQLTIRNDSNTAQELFDGKQCDVAGAACADLVAQRLYPGAVLVQELRYDTPVTYQASTGSTAQSVTF